MTIYRLVHHGELEAIRVGRSFRIPEAAVNQYLRAAFVESSTALVSLGASSAPQILHESGFETLNLQELGASSIDLPCSGPAARAKDGQGNQENAAVFRPASGQKDAATAIGIIPISIYLADEHIHKRVERAVGRWLATADVSIDERDNPVIGSWFRRMKASVKEAAGTPFAREALLTGIHAADNRLTNYQDAYITATLLQNVGPLLQSLQPTKDAVIRAGALLIVKIDWEVQVHQLTAAQQAILDHRPQLATSPQDIITALQLSESVLQEAAVPPGDTVSRQ